MKLEIGGGNPNKKRGDDWVNVDCIETADVRHDLNQHPWPFDDESVTEIYTSHCLEHLDRPMEVLREMARICKVGAPIEIRVPHPLSDLAMVWDHKHVLSPIALINAEHHYPADCWLGPRRMKLLDIKYRETFLFHEAKRELPFLAGMSDEMILKWIPRTCHECCFYYEVIVNEFAKCST